MIDCSKDKPNIFFVEQYIYPEGWSGAQISRDIINYLNDKGIKVNVVCGTTFYQKPHVSDTNQFLNNEVNLIKLNTFKSNKSTIKNFLNQILFSLKANCRIFFIKEKVNCLIIQTNPPLFLISAAIISYFKRIPLVVIAMDIYPEHIFASINSNYFKKTFQKIISFFFNFSYRKAAGIISLGNSSTQRLLKKGIIKEKIYEINNWATGPIKAISKKQNILYKKWNLSTKSFNIIYSGNLGLAHDYKTIIDSCKNLDKIDFEVKFLFVVSGRKVNLAKKYTSDLKLDNRISFHEIISPEMVPYSFSLSKLALVTIDKDFNGIVHPSKLYGYLARGLPVLYIGPENDINDILLNYSCGFCFRNNDSKNVSNLIKELLNNDQILMSYSKSARKCYEDNFSSQIGLKKYYSVISKFL